jgi:DNA modification methylase
VTEFAIHCCDCVTGFSEHLEPESVDLTVTSIPFGSLFMYSGKTEDVGNNQDGVAMRDSMFGLHLRFVAEQLLAVHKPGTNCCIHIQQLVTYRIQHGYMGRRDFRGAVIDVFEAAGWEWKGEVSIPKNPQVIAQRQKLHSLLFITGRRNARDLAPAVNDFVLFFQKPGEAEVPLQALRHEENPSGWVTGDEWIRWARGTWDDIREIDVLEGWQDVREEDDEKHVCPLQLEVIRRCVMLYSAPGELVLDPFMGIGSTAFTALGGASPHTGLAVAGGPRRAVGFELKESYHGQAVKNAGRALSRGNEAQTSLLDLPEAEAAA